MARVILTQEELAPVLGDLPNFPVPLIDQWLGNAVRALGWPPPCDPKAAIAAGWHDGLARHPLDLWRKVTWALERQKLTDLPLEPESRETIFKLARAYGRGYDDPVAARMGGQERLNELAQSVARNGIMPEPPVLLVRRDTVELIDGYRRLAAFVFCIQEGLVVEEHPELWIGHVREQEGP